MKILIASLPGQTGINDAIAVEAQVLAYCPTAVTEKVYYYSMADVVNYAVANDYNGIARNVSDFATSYAQAAIAAAAGIWISWGHGSVSHVLRSSPDHLVENAIGVGKGTSGVNAASYGPALDFFVDGALNESQACGAVAGRIGQLLIENPILSFDIVRYLLQKNSSAWPGASFDGGFGAVNLGAIAINQSSNEQNIFRLFYAY